MNIPIKDIILPKVSILTPTFNRRKFLRLMISNIKYFDYPKDKLEWLILDSLGKEGEKGERLFNNIDEIKRIKNFLGIEINYHFIDKKMSIGQKRNWLSENSKFDILINMDDDDIYISSYIRNSIEMLLNFDKDIVGCIDMLFIYPNDNYKMTIIEFKDYELYDESTLCMKKSHWEKYMYKETSKGEGEDIYGKEEICGITKSQDCIICVCWEKNTINKEGFKTNIIDLNIEGEQINILKNIFNKETDKVKIPIKLLQNYRNLLENTNNRIKWKTSEILSVGLMIKQIDELLEKNIII